MLMKLIDGLLEMFSHKQEVTIEDLYLRSPRNHVSIYHPETSKLKFIGESTPLVMVKGKLGWVKVNAVRRTVPYREVLIKTRNKRIICADTHIFIVNSKHVYAKDITSKTRLELQDGYDTVVFVKHLETSSNMYDLDIASYDHSYYTNGFLSHNSTTVAAGFMLHQIVFGEFDRWAILANKGSTAREILSRLKQAFELVPLWMKPGVTEWNKGRISLDNGCVVMAESTSSDAIRGQSCSGILIDEFAHIDNVNEFYTSVMPVISSGLNTRVVIVSTPNGKGNLFHKTWTDANNGLNGFVPVTVDWTVVPERNEEWKEGEIKRLGITKFQQEYECSFSASENTLVDLQILESITTIPPLEYIHASKLSIYKQVINNHKYVIAVDTAMNIGQDYSTFQVIDITALPYEQVAVFRSNNTNPLIIPRLIVDVAMRYNKAYILVEINKGAEIAKDIYYEYEYDNLLQVGKDKQSGRQRLGAWLESKLGLLQSSATKSKGCMNLKYMIEYNQIILNDITTVEELFTFIRDGSSYAADKGKHDDLVMSLVIFAWMASEDYFKELTSLNVNKNIVKSYHLEDLLPFGIILDGTEDDTYEYNEYNEDDEGE